eukprot:977762-Alexandrium_andersonii.AAC.1
MFVLLLSRLGCSLDGAPAAPCGHACRARIFVFFRCAGPSHVAPPRKALHFQVLGTWHLGRAAFEGHDAHARVSCGRSPALWGSLVAIGSGVFGRT